MQISVYTDGGSRGNPGHSGYGLVIYDESQQILFKEAKYLGIKTNNEAEYAGLIGALTWIKQNQESKNITQINFHSDSQLMVRQLQGAYKVRAPNLIPIFQKKINYLPFFYNYFSFINSSFWTNSHKLRQN